jgi:hypothetical protein
LVKWVRLKSDLHIDRLALAHRFAQVDTLNVWPRLTRPLPRATFRQFFLDAAQALGRAVW